MKSKNPLFRRFSRLNALQVADMALSELEQNTRLAPEEQSAFCRRVARAMEQKLNHIKTAPNELTCLTCIIRRALVPDAREGYSCIADMLIDLHRARPQVEAAMAAMRRQSEGKLSPDGDGQTPPEEIHSDTKTPAGGKPRRPFCERAIKPLGITLSLLLGAGLLAAGGVALHYLYPNGMFLTPVEVPQLVGQNLTEASPDSELFSLSVTYQYNRDTETGVILAQSPQAGMTRRVSPGRHPCTLTLLVSLGPEKVQVGDYAGMTQYQAMSACRRLGLIPEIETVADHPAGNVARTEPTAGEVLTAGSTVTLYVGTSHRVAQVAVPNLIGVSEVGAGTILSSLGLVRGTVSYMTSDEAAGVVIAQSVLSGSAVAAGTRVSIVVSKGGG